MGVDYRKARGKWGYRIYLHGGILEACHRWDTREEAERAFKDAMKRVEAIRALPPTSLQSAAEAYLMYLFERKSRSRYEGVRFNLERHILPYFGPATFITDITPGEVERFMHLHLKRVKPMTVWHYVKDLRALLNFARKRGLLTENPGEKADLSPLANRFTPKQPLSLSDVQQAAQALRGRDRLYFDTLRYIGLRKSESNLVQVQDCEDIDGALWLTVKGTKTPASHRVIPIPPILWDSYHSIIREMQPEHYIFGRNGNRVSDRRKLFDRIQRITAIENYKRNHPNASDEEAVIAVKNEKFIGGIKLKPKDLRDYFASVMKDPVVASKMLGHSSLRTTAIYTRQVQERMVEAVADLGTKPLVQPTPKKD